MRKTTLILAGLLFTLSGCNDLSYRYPCQDPANKDEAECNRPACEESGQCFDTLNGLPPKQEPTVQENADQPHDVNCNCETKGE